MLVVCYGVRNLVFAEPLLRPDLAVLVKMKDGKRSAIEVPCIGTQSAVLEILLLGTELHIVRPPIRVFCCLNLATSEVRMPHESSSIELMATAEHRHHR